MNWAGESQKKSISYCACYHHIETWYRLRSTYTNVVIVVSLMMSFAFLPWAMFCKALCTPCEALLFFMFYIAVCIEGFMRASGCGHISVAAQARSPGFDAW